MEAKFLASALSFLSIFLAIYAQSFANDIVEIIDNIGNNNSGGGRGGGEGGGLEGADESTELEGTPAIYYGDSNVNLGEPFSITCIIPITEDIFWLKNGEPITRHNLRHGRDEHAYILAESAIEGEKHKIEAHLSVRHALKVHEGSYQCNRRHGSSHMLYVRSAGSAMSGSSATESGYQTIDEITSNAAATDDIFTRTWLEQQQQQQQQPTSTHHQQQQHKPHKHHLGGGLYGNSSSSSTQSWHHMGADNAGGIHRIYSATPPDIPPPRFGLFDHTVSQPEPPTILYNQTLMHHNPLQTLDTTTAIDRSNAPAPPALPPYLTTMSSRHHVGGGAVGGGHQQGNLQHTLNSFQLPAPPPHSVGGHQRQHTAQNEKYQTYAPQFVPQGVGGAAGVTTTTTTTTTSSAAAASVTQSMSTPAGGYMGSMKQQPKTLLPNKKDPELVPNYDNAEHQMKFYTIKSPLVLSCNVKNLESSGPLIWKKNGTNVMDVASLRGRFRLIEAEQKFIIDKAEPQDDGQYSCEINSLSKVINVLARVVVRVPSNTAVVEGEKMSVTCSVVGTDPQLIWTYRNLTLRNSTGRYILSPNDNVENAILTLENVTLDDKGDYKCYGSNAANEYGVNSTVASDFTTVRVKGKFAALWPFLGICAEVLILCVIILIYEKRRNKSELEESDTDPQEQ
ncbi:uncharacterized protein Bsg [Drosophila tropicalis]|uniref:uncharacterized protein Bsg n=1 Tax=Drosophila tropicalis TaxID=46794 RepID=UPI0035ABB323